jgi:hypothetical protein
MAAILGDISHDSDEPAMEIGEIANSFAVIRPDEDVKRAVTFGWAEREVSCAALGGGDPENFPRDASMLID